MEQAAEILHISRDKTYYLIRTGQLRSIKSNTLRRAVALRSIGTDRRLAWR